jgi:hypothetical protein
MTKEGIILLEGRTTNNAVCTGETSLIPYSLPETKMAQTWNTNWRNMKKK